MVFMIIKVDGKVKLEEITSGYNRQSHDMKQKWFIHT